ncbi:hypothetical protein ACFFX0_22555 [Citricoccus parietis]|uniref:Uncharacterized protein n=1 Tax=Citricoccus parietis TaxID=592307 RepID=A0ABV5G4H0_9MICC
MRRRSRPGDPGPSVRGSARRTGPRPDRPPARSATGAGLRRPGLHRCRPGPAAAGCPAGRGPA